MEISTIHNLFLTCDSISIDTRNISQNSMFIALKGDRFDANTFAEQALEKGAKYVIIDKSSDVICNNCSTTDNEEDSTNTSFITWNIAYQMKLTSSGYYTSKFYCSTIDTNPTECVEEEKVYKKFGVDVICF